jgi:hypothetical protein
MRQHMPPRLMPVKIVHHMVMMKMMDVPPHDRSPLLPIIYSYSSFFRRQDAHISFFAFDGAQFCATVAIRHHGSLESL